jgi:hypothetical protein
MNAKNATKMFKWCDGTEAQFNALPLYNLNPSVSGLECVAFKNNGTWFDRQCQNEEKRPFICEKPIA